MDHVSSRPSARDARRQAILEIACEIFLTEGFAEASMSSVAARLGGSKGTLYNYFPSKQELFAAVIVDECDRKQAALFDSLPTEGEDIRTVLKTVGERYVELVLSEPSIQLSRVVIAECARFPELGRVLYEAGPKRARVRLADYLQAQMNCGVLRQADAMLVSGQFCEMCLANVYRQRLMNLIPTPSPVERGTLVDAAVKVILAGYVDQGSA